LVVGGFRPFRGSLAKVIDLVATSLLINQNNFLTQMKTVAAILLKNEQPPFYFLVMGLIGPAFYHKEGVV
jgi:hypothetical protein